MGPYIVVRRSRKGAYVLKDMTGDILDRHVPADQLKLVRRQITVPKQHTNVFEVEKILSHRGSPGKYEYLVQWKGYDENDNSWVSQSDFHDIACISKYWNSNATTQRR